MNMTNDEILIYYASLLIMQYAGKTKAVNHVKSNVNGLLMEQLPLAIKNAFNLDNATGVQLEILGKYIGASKYGSDFSGEVMLSDDQYVNLLKMKIIQNFSNSSLYQIDDFLNRFFPNVIRFFDYESMRINYMFNSSFGQQLAEFFVVGGHLPKPMGVKLSPVIVAADIDHFFGYSTCEVAAYKVSGFNFCEGYALGTPWLSCADALV